MINLYLVKSSFGSYDDYRECNDTVIYATLEAADQAKDKIIDMYSSKPFPFKWCTQEEFEEFLDEGKSLTEKDIEIYEQWYENNSKEFGTAWVETIELDLKSWREKQLNNIL